MEKYLKRAVTFAEELKAVNRKSVDKKCQTHFHLAHYADALFRSHEERLNSSEWQAALRLRKHKVLINLVRKQYAKQNRFFHESSSMQKLEMEALVKRFRSSTKASWHSFEGLLAFTFFPHPLPQQSNTFFSCYIGGENRLFTKNTGAAKATYFRH